MSEICVAVPPLRRLRWARAGTVALVASVLVVGCARPPDPDLGVQIFCGQSDNPACPPGELRLEIGSRAWRLNEDGGVAIVSSADAQPVRLVAVDTCDVLVAFTAEAGHRYTVEVAAADTASLRDLEGTNIGFNYGPSMAESAVSDCQ